MSPKSPPRRAGHEAGDDAALGERMRGKLGGLISRAATRTGEGADRLREAARDLRKPVLLQQGLAAQERGNMEAAFWLLDEAYRTQSDDPEIAVAFWDVARQLGRASAAEAAGRWLVEHHAGANAVDLAAQYFTELSVALPEALVTPTAVVRMLPALQQGVAAAGDEQRPAAQALLRRALRLAVDPNNEEPSPGLAFRLYKEGRDLEPEAARRAAEFALASPDLHEAKRAELRRWLAEDVDPFENPIPEPPAEDTRPAEDGTGEEPDTDELEVDDLDVDDALDTDFDLGDDEPPLDPLSDEQVAAAAERLPAPGSLEDLDHPLEAGGDWFLQAVPVAIGEEALELLLPGERSSRVGWREIQALAVGVVPDLASKPVTVIDCILNWRRRDREPLRVVRLRDDTFEPKTLVEEGIDEAVHGFLSEILERSHAVPLPDPEAALGLQQATFESLASYEREVLGRS